MMEFEIFIPSYRRAKNCETAGLLKKATIVCHESEAKEYREENPGRKIKVAPDKVAGNMARVRNWILDNAETPAIVMADDDLFGFVRFLGGEAHDMNEQDIYLLMENGFIMAEDLGVHLWGVNLQADPRFYREYSPINFIYPILGPFMGIIQDGSRFDERLPLKEDYDFFLQAIFKDRKVLRFNKYAYRARHVTQKGGCADRRTMEAEKENGKILIKKWGSKIVTFDYARSINPRIRIPFSGS